MKSEYTFTAEQVVAIVLGIVFGSAARPRHDISAYLTPVLGGLGGYVAGIIVWAFIAALLGLIAYAILQRINTNRNSPQPTKD